METGDRPHNRHLDDARAALARGKLAHALRLGWRAANSAVRDRDAPALTEVEALAGELRGRMSGRLAADAETLERYASYCRGDVERGTQRQSALGWLLQGSLRNPEGGTKTCPDCAEAVRREARVCRFCGFRFDE